MTADQAETVALRALAWLAGEPDLFEVFLGSTGLAPADLVGRAAEPEMLAAVLGFVTMDDVWIARFCESEGLPYGAPLAARGALPGGAAPEWT